jgi:serine/threonine protein kinase
LTADDDVRARFPREADHIARLDHPNIVAVYDRGDQDGQLWIAMQYVDGSDAPATLRQGPMPAARAVRIIAETAKARDFAHAADVLHRDVKPANIMLTQPTAGEPERVQLADFAIANGLDEPYRVHRDRHVSRQPAIRRARTTRRLGHARCPRR